MKGQRIQLTIVAATTPTRKARPRTEAGGVAPPEVTNPSDTTVKDRQPARPERFNRWISHKVRGGVNMNENTYRVAASRITVHHGKQVQQREGTHDKGVAVSRAVCETTPEGAQHDNGRSDEKIAKASSNPGTVSAWSSTSTGLARLTLYGS